MLINVLARGFLFGCRIGCHKKYVSANFSILLTNCVNPNNVLVDDSDALYYLEQLCEEEKLTPYECDAFRAKLKDVL